MNKHCGLLLLFLTCVTTSPNVYSELSLANEFSRFSLWPSVHNAATLIRSRRATPLGLDANTDPKIGAVGPNEGGNDVSLKTPTESSVISSPSVTKDDQKATGTLQGNPGILNGNSTITMTPETNLKASNETSNNTTPKNITPKSIITVDTQQHNITLTGNATHLNVNGTVKAKAINLDSPGVVKRGIIVFGGFTLMAVAYFIFYKRKNQNNDMGSSLGMNDANQFRYGVLQSEDMKDNLESSRIPLTMESEDEVDDDLEIFDLVQKKKSLSYVNLQQNDEEIVLSPRETGDIEDDNLLLDIEDASTDTLINWNNNASKSIL